MNIINKDIYNNLELLPKDLQGWNGTNGIFEELITAHAPELIVEVGTWKGQSACNMGRIIKSNGLNTKILCIDTFLGASEFWCGLKDTPERNLLLRNGYPQIYYQFLSNVVHENLQDIIDVFPNTSTIGSKYLKYLKISPDITYIDASHDYEDVLSDLNSYYDITKNVLFGDDYGIFPGVTDAVNNFTASKNIRYKVKDNFWIIIKE